MTQHTASRPRRPLRQAHPSASSRNTLLFVALTFAFAWALWGYWVVAMPPGGLVISPAFLACALVGGLAPSLAAIAVSAIAGGWGRVRELLSQAVQPVSWRLALFAALVAPMAAGVAYLAQISAGFQLRWPDPSLLVMALIWPVMASLGEEVGWRGYLLPRLAPRWGLVPAALAIGLLWGLWHLPADYIALKAYGPLFWLAFLINGPIVLTAHSIIVSVLWARSGRSLLVALLYHWGITFSAIVAPSVGGETPSALAASAVGAAAVWIAAAMALFVYRTTASTQSMAETA